MKTLFLAVLMAGAATSALAADLPTRKGEPMAPPVYAPAFTWGGLYLGVNGGLGFSNIGSTNFASATGGEVGGTFGYNWQMGQVVFGGEADLDWASISAGNSTAFGNTNYKINWMTTERLRLGYAVDRALFYVTGGYAGMSTQASINDVFGYSNNQNRWRSGGVIGGGVEYAFTNNITAKVEYLWAPMENETYWAATPYTETDHLNVSLLRVGLNYKF